MTENLDQSIIHDNALPVGTRLKHYVIEKLLGHGAFSLVYLARDESLARQVAIKEYLPEQLATRTQGNTITVSPNTENNQSMFTQWRNNFRQEAQQIAQLYHPAIVQVIEVFEANNTAYMVMPYYAGESLKCFQERTHKRWNEAELNTFLEPLLNALELLHQQNILHRDIAPDNIFLKGNGQPILIDFGAARRIESKYTQSMQYKHGYSPIEHYSPIGKSQAGPWTDIYSLAAVVYELATGKKVHPATYRANDDQMPSLKACHPVGLTASFITSIDLALAIKGKDRPQSISAWRDCMKMGKQATLNTKPTPVSFNFKNYQRPLLILGSGLLIVVLAYGLSTEPVTITIQTVQAQLDPIPATLTVQVVAQVIQVNLAPTPPNPIPPTPKNHGVNGRLIESMNSPEPQRDEEIRLEAIKKAKAQLKGDDETLWQAAVTYLT
jgi:serine/threonine protein kinase